MEGSVIIILIISAVLGFFIMAGAVAVGTIAALNHVERHRAKEAGQLERKTYKPSELRARREMPPAQAVQAPVQPSAKPHQWQ
jgi:hypothetical protein